MINWNNVTFFNVEDVDGTILGEVKWDPHRKSHRWTALGCMEVDGELLKRWRLKDCHTRGEAEALVCEAAKCKDCDGEGMNEDLESCSKCNGKGRLI